jgi:hypothetical protein
MSLSQNQPEPWFPFWDGFHNGDLFIMKKHFFLPLLLSFFAACSNPLLDWIETPGGSITLSASDKAITAFSFGFGESETDTIRVNPRNGKTPITVVLPAGSNKSNLSPAITIIGKSISPPSGTAQNFNAPVTYRVTAEDGSWREYEVEVVVKTAASAEIIWFDIQLPKSGGRLQAEGNVITVNESSGNIVIHVPSGTDTSALTAEIVQTGTLTGPEANTAKTAVTLTTNFSDPVQYTVHAENGSTKNYVVTVVVDPSDAKEITDFSFDGITSSEIIAGVPLPDGTFPILIEVPAGTTISSLTPVITHTGVSIAGDQNSVDFTGSISNPRSYTVTAEDGTTRSYAVTVMPVSSDPGTDDNAKQITGFYFTSPVAAGVIDQTNKTITVKVPYGTNLASLVPTIYYNALRVDPASGAARNFSSPAIYTAWANNGTSQQYTVYVQPEKDNAKEITVFTFPDAGVLETVIGSVPGPGGKIPISVTLAPNTGPGILVSLAPAITHTGKTISPETGTPGDFRTPVSYRVTAENGTTKDYSVSVHISGNSSAVITGFVFKPADNSSLAALVVGAIDQDTYDIDVVLPRSSALSDSLKPAITYIGASITPPDSVTPETAKPFTDSARSFDTSPPRIYTVTAADGSAVEYTVHVSLEEENLGLSVTFLPIEELDFVTQSFDQNTGIITLTLDTSDLEPNSPYEWRLDGVRLPVSDTESRLELLVAGFKPGRHEIVAIVKKDADDRYYTNKVYFLVEE